MRFQFKLIWTTVVTILGIYSSSFAQLVLTHEFTTSTFISVFDENLEPTNYDYFANETTSISSERIQFSYDENYTFRQDSVTAGWSFQDNPDPGSTGTITRTYYFGGIDESATNEKFYFDTPFNLNFSLLKTDPGQTETTHTLNYLVSARGFYEGTFIAGGPLGDFETTLIDPYAVPEPSTYALIMGAVVLIPILWLRIHKRDKDTNANH